MEKFQNKYRIPSARLRHWDYRWAGAYFITICTQNRAHCFGEIADGKIQLSHVGVIANVLWYEIKNRAKNIELGEFVVMPNHIHGILIINDKTDNVGNGNDLVVETLHATSLLYHQIDHNKQRKNPTIKSTNRCQKFPQNQIQFLSSFVPINLP
jgi:putative transposase